MAVWENTFFWGDKGDVEIMGYLTAVLGNPGVDVMSYLRFGQ
jgi:hypothetical protein